MSVKPAGWLRPFCVKAEMLGFVFDGYTGSGHPRFKSSGGKTYTTSLTPSDWRAERNAIAEMERLSGRKLPRDNAAHYRYKRVTKLDFRKSESEIESGAEIDGLIAETESMRERFRVLTESNTRASAEEARRLVEKFEICRQELANRYRHIEPLW